ncbi:hypothetical protein BBM29_20005 [Vibrio parahaemolyticus]|nr:hypothetical protein BBM29_20005 [Vibrio parahaemolyticus]
MYPYMYPKVIIKLKTIENKLKPKHKQSTVIKGIKPTNQVLTKPIKTRDLIIRHELRPDFKSIWNKPLPLGSGFSLSTDLKILVKKHA